MLSILGYRPNDLLEKSLYEYHHGADSEMLMNAFKNGKLSTLSLFNIARNRDVILYMSRTGIRDYTNSRFERVTSETVNSKELIPNNSNVSFPVRLHVSFFSSLFPESHILRH